MGYRSDVVAVIGMPSMDFFYGTMAALKLSDIGVYEFIEHHSCIREEKLEPERWMIKEKSHVPPAEGMKCYVWQFRVDDVKWYPDYSEVKAWNEVMEAAIKEGLYVKFLSVGDSLDDLTCDETDVDEDDLIKYMTKYNVVHGATEKEYKSWARLYMWCFSSLGSAYDIERHIDIDIPYDEKHEEKTKRAQDVLSQQTIHN